MRATAAARPLVVAAITAVTMIAMARPGAAALSGPACPAAAMPAAPAPHLRAALARHEPAVIVAFGSSSTRGWQSSDPAHSYPAVLQARLSALLSHAHIAVINRGVNGEDAAEELARLQADVIAVRPQLVIWQVGANGVLRVVDPAVYTKLVTAGIAMLHQAGIDVVLMDNQRAPRILAVPEHAAIDRATAAVAKLTESDFFDRGALMDAWARAGSPYQQFIAPDQLHHNDLGYRCLAEAVASSIAAGLGSSEPGGNGPGSNMVAAGGASLAPGKLGVAGN